MTLEQCFIGFEEDLFETALSELNKQEYTETELELMRFAHKKGLEAAIELLKHMKLLA